MRKFFLFIVAVFMAANLNAKITKITHYEDRTVIEYNITYYYNYGHYPVEFRVYGKGPAKAFLQESYDCGKSWVPVKGKEEQETLSDFESIFLFVDGIKADRIGASSLWYRVVVADLSITPNVLVYDTIKLRIEYPYTRHYLSQLSPVEGGSPVGMEWRLDKPAYCSEYKITSELPVVTREDDNYFYFTMPACPVELTEVLKKYTVKFLNADYSFLKSVEVACGSDATDLAPTPTMGDYTFIGWNKDLTNVHSSFSAVAKYDVGDNYWLNAYVTDHKNEVFPFPGMEKSDARAMVGDKVTVTADVFASAKAGVYYETAPWSNSEQRFLWDPNSGKKVGDYNDPNQERFFDQEISIAYDANTQYVHPFEYKVGVRFYIMLAGVKVYSDPVEIDVCYPMTITSLTGDGIFAENADGDFVQDLTAMIPARYHDTIRVFSINGAGGGCLSFARVLYPSRLLDSGVDEQGQAYFVCPGETETINVDAVKKLIVFDGVYGNGYPKQLDFTAEGFGKLNGYYGEVVPCGGSVQNMPEDPEEEGAVFMGWQAWSTDYADDAYAHVPAIDENILGFTAQFEYLPEVPQYTVRFYGKDGAELLDTQLVNEGDDAVPPVAPEVSGFHFTGWDKPYTTITADVDIIAIYGEDAKTWTVTYYDADKTTKLGEETVNDGEAAQGIAVSAPYSYHLAKWMDLSNDNVADLMYVSKNMAVYAAYELNVYTITYTFGKTMQIGEVVVIGEELVKHGDMPLMWQSYESLAKTEFEEELGEKMQLDNILWSPAIAPATEDAAYDLAYVFSPRQYTVRFRNWDFSLLDEQQVEYGKAAQAPADPTREGYTFVGWDREFSNIKADMTVTALFEKNKPQGIEDIAVPAGDAQKILMDGVLLIERNGKTYNAQGAEVR